ncbi:hypothetical protein [Oleidesulfovibrio sp.]|uniref:hypothetical protein n=1 Tax=Oleidesulfovibrio sp. TaxID=2909707 RepID=UPI003A873427
MSSAQETAAVHTTCSHPAKLEASTEIFNRPDVCMIAAAVRGWLLRRSIDSRLQDYATSLGIDDLHAALFQLAGRTGAKSGVVYDENILEQLFEYILFPDEELCLRVEQCVIAAEADGREVAEGCCAVPADMVSAVCRHLSDAEAVISLPLAIVNEPEAGCIHVAVALTALQQLVARLCVGRVIPACVHACTMCVGTSTAQETEESLADDSSLRLYAMIRQLIRRSSLQFTPFRCFMIQCYLEAVPHSFPQFLQGLRIWLALLERVAPLPGNPQQAESDLFSALSKRRARLNKTLRDGQEFEQRLRRFNMETLMMQGVRPPAADPVIVREEISVLDRVCIALFRCMPSGAELSEHDLGTFGVSGSDYAGNGPFDPKTEVMALMRTLS